jgi:DNA repair protein RadC
MSTPPYLIAGPLTPDQVLEKASEIMLERLVRQGKLSSPQDTRNYLTAQLGPKEHEVFLVLFLDNQNQLLASEEMFRGTINAASVYPREIVKAALQHNAAAVILAHNHPSGEPEPSQADRSLTERLLAALSLVDIRVLDHLVIGGSNTVSFAERGWL